MERMRLTEIEGNTMQWTPGTREIDARKLFDIAWKDMLDSEPFFGAKMFSLEIIETSEIDTMATDGKRLLFNPTFTSELTRKECGGVERHEIEHVVRLHHVIAAEMKKELGEKYDHQILNQAGDYEINQDLRNWRVSLPEDHLYDERFQGMLLREIYFILYYEQQSKPEPNEPGKTGEEGNGKPSDSSGGTEDVNGPNDSDNSDSSDSGSDPDSRANSTREGEGSSIQRMSDNGSDSGGSGGADSATETPKLPVIHGEVLVPENEDGSELSNEDIKTLRRDAEKSTMAAAKFAEKQERGTMESVTGIVDRLESAPQDWSALLEDYFESFTDGEATWNRPKKALYSQGITLPSAKKERVGKVVIADDQSSSVSDRLSAMWVEKLNEILSEFDEIEIVRIPFTHTVGEPEFYNEGDVQLAFEGRMHGGTDYVPVFAEIDSLDFEPDAVLVLTDMLCSSFPDDPGYPVVWCEACEGYQRKYTTEPPFGELIKIRD